MYQIAQTAHAYVTYVVTHHSYRSRRRRCRCLRWCTPRTHVRLTMGFIGIFCT
jgi:hypothetical protein